MNKKEEMAAGEQRARALGFLGVQLAVFWILFPNPKKRWEQDTYDCALVCGYHAKEDGSPTDVMKKRVEKAVELWKERKVRYLLLSGGAVANPYVEAEVMKKYALELGVPEQYLVLEKRAGLHVPQLEIRGSDHEKLRVFRLRGGDQRLASSKSRPLCQKSGA